ncbi:MAG TPA: ZIP family metal transporter [Burkholderiales bacterium]|nr:ZIP family metal transporter [Burkholderiales bacterium]
MTLTWILLASLAGGVLSVCAAAFALWLRASWVSTLVSFAIGTLLGAAFLEVIPEVFAGGDARRGAAAILGGILGFFVLEKLLLWRHSHDHGDEGGPTHHHEHERAGMLVVVGDTIHNFVDGVLIAAAFLQSPQLGLVTSIAIVAHEIPQEVGDFLVLLHSGYSRARAFTLNVLSSLGSVAGGLLGYFTLQGYEHWEPVLLGVVAASMIYVAVADLIPGLHRRPELRATAQQAVLIAAGVGVIALVGSVVRHAH